MTSSGPDDLGGGDVKKDKPPKAKNDTVEKIYQKKSQLEHILLRPDTYIGSVEFVKDQMWVYNTESQSLDQREVSYVPGLYKIFDEILVNAADNKQRDPSMDCIKIDINAEKNIISIFNNGKGIPVVIHKGENMYVPTMIFGHLLTSSNYNDEEEKVTGGRNGYGAKLCNIFSSKFTVETASREYKRCFKQTWGSNMSKASEPVIKDFSGEDYTKITFSPDLTKFKMTELDKDTVDLLSRRAFDVAASTRGVKVFLNGKKIPVKNFEEYVKLYVKGKEDDKGVPLKVVYENVNARWEVAATLSEKGYQQVSFVNSIATTKGGRHVDHVADAICKNLAALITKKNKGNNPVKPFQVKNYLWVFVNCLIVNPTFDSQTKENMTLQVKSFGSKCVLTEKFLSQVSKSSGITDSVLSWAKFKAQEKIQKVNVGKKQTKLTGVPKLEDANDAGTRNSLDCTLILTEGDSAKSLAVSGLGVIGRDKYGVFPLRGKVLNVREATTKQILENIEINNIIKIMGLQYKRKYENQEDLRTLRYGRLMIMTDQDQDGSHIKGLLINFIHANWPSLLKIPFLEEFITPIVKATKKKEEFSFYSLPEFEEWKTSKENWHTYKIKYYKGLGTSTSKEAKEYFSDMNRHRITFNYSGPNDDHHIMLAFSKKMVDQRKDWLTNWMEDTKRRRELGLKEQYLYEKNTKTVNYTDFINKELVLFSNGDNERSIPSMVDGLKPGQRKVIFTCLKRNDKREVKVAQLAGSVGEQSAYHHGEASLMTTIIGLAQNFVGSNNINLLQPIGQFGTRLTGGKDAASPRYIFTMLSPLAKCLFHPHDEPLLAHQYDDGQKIEPVWYIPVIPMVLVNGADGIGTGWMTKIPNYNPREIITNLRLMLEGEEPKPMLPWYKNFKGEIQELGDTRYIMYGEVSIINEDKVEITELPVGTWTQSYKENVLEPMLNGADKSPAVIQDYKEYNTDTTVRFVIKLTPETLHKVEKSGLHKFFKLQNTTTTTSMCVFDENCCMKRVDSVLEILQKFYDLRLSFYNKRKDYLEGMLHAEALKLSNQARFIIEKCNGTLVIENKKKKVMMEELKKSKYDPDPVKAWKLKQNKEDALAEQAEEDAQNSQADEEDEMTGQYDYLLGMKMWCLTLERKNEIIKQRDEKQHELKVLQGKSPSQLWKDDLDALLVELDRVEAEERAEEAGETSKAVKAMKLGGKKGGNKKAMVDTMPSPAGRKIAPMIDEEMKKKIEKAVAAKDKPKRERGTKGKNMKSGTSDERDEFDLMGEAFSKPLTARLGTSPEIIEKKMQAKRKEVREEGLKQTKLPFKSKPPSPKKRTKGRSQGSSSDDMDDSASDMSDEVTFSPKSVPASQPARQVARRTAAAKVKFTYDSDEDGSGFDSDLELHDNTALKNGETGPVIDNNLDSLRVSDSEDSEPKPTKKRKPMSDSEDDDFPIHKQAPPKSNNSDAMFDSLLGGSGSGDQNGESFEIVDDSPVVPKAPPKKRPLAKKTEVALPKKTVAKKASSVKMSDSDSDSTDTFEKKKAPAKKPAAPRKPAQKKKRAFDSDDDVPKKKSRKKAGSESDESFELQVDSDTEAVRRANPASARARKPVKYNFGAESDSD